MRAPITLKRDVLATRIPSGEPVVLPAQSQVQVTQELGGSLTVMGLGVLARVDARDAAALGPEWEEWARTLAEEKANRLEGPFEMERVWDQLRTVYDPEIPVDLVELGLVYECRDIALGEGEHRIEIKMTVTAPGCGMGDILRQEVGHKVLEVPGVKECEVELTFDPPWDQSRMTEAARLQLGLF
jgi:probable FeS assembly SUF system protein SufT